MTDATQTQQAPQAPTAVPMNPLHYQVALNEATVQLQLLSSRAQMLAVELHEARSTNQLLQARIADLESQNVGLSSKLEEVQKTK
ncbi:hypothetical protein RCRUDOLPH_63 [Rhodobacter phage RcRudolph]|nr:hypothetical protein RCRUDOLPH_63 [Rhodobacter phage RcRudolph]